MKKILVLALCASTLSGYALPTYEPFSEPEFANALAASSSNSVDLCNGGFTAPTGEVWGSMNWAGTFGTGLVGVDILVSNDPTLFTYNAVSPLLPATFPGLPAPGQSITNVLLNPAQPLVAGVASPNIIGNSAVLIFNQDITRPTNGVKTLYISYLWSIAQVGQLGGGNDARYLAFVAQTNTVEGTNTGFYTNWHNMLDTLPGTCNHASHSIIAGGSGYYNVASDNATGKEFTTTSFTSGYGAVQFIVGAITLTANKTYTNTMWVNPSTSAFGGATPPASPIFNDAITSATLQMNDIGGMVVEDRPGKGASAGGLGSNFMANILIGTTWSYVTGGPEFTNQPGNVATNYAASATLSAAATAAAQSVTYQWQRVTVTTTNNVSNGSGGAGGGATVSGATTGTLSLAGLTAGDFGSYQVVATATGTGYSLTSAAGTVTPTDPAISAQPQSTIANYGGTATFTATAQTALAPLTYAWYDGTTMLVNGAQTDGSTVSGASGTSAGGTLNTTLTIANVSDADDGSYTLVVTNNGNGTSTSAIATLLVNDPFISAQPPATVEVLPGGSATISVPAGGSGVTYQWYSVANGPGPVGNGGDFSGATTASLEISDAQSTDDGTYYLLVNGNNGSLQSSNVIFAVDTIPTSVGVTPTNVTQQTGTHLALIGSSTVASGLVNSVWEFNGATLSDGTKPDGSWVIGSATPALILSNLQVTDSGTYTYIASNSAGYLESNSVVTVTAGLLPLTTSNLEVLRVGDGAEALSGATGNTLYLDQFQSNGTYVSTIMVPDSGPPALVVAGGGTDGTNEAFMTLSSNQYYLNFAGYCYSYPFIGGSDVTVGGNSGVRGIAAVTAQGNYVLAYTNFGLYSGGNHVIRDAYSTDGLTNFWTTGAAGSGTIKYVNAGPAGASYTTVSPGNGIIGLSLAAFGSRALGLAGSNLVFSDAQEVLSPNVEGLNVFTGAPEPGVSTYSSLTENVVAFGSPTDFAFSPDTNTVYVGDDGAVISSTGYGGGIQRWDFVGGSYQYQYTLEDTTGSGVNGVRGLTVFFPPNITQWGQGINGAVVYGTTAEAVSNRVIQFVDNGVNSPSTLLATAGPNQAYRGIRFGPATEPITISLTPQSDEAYVGETITLTATAAGYATLGAQWKLNGTTISGFTQTNYLGSLLSTLTLSNISTISAGTYTIVVTNQTQSNSAQAILTVPVGAPQIYQDVQPLAAVQPVGTPVVFTAIAVGSAPLSYQWTLNGTNLTDSAHVIGSQSNVLTIGNSQLSDSGSYQLVVTNSAGMTNTSEAALTITLIGFNSGAGWTANGGTSVSTNGLLTLTDGGLSETRSFFLDEPVDDNAFIASWTYQESPGNSTVADGTAFVLQNTAAGTKALGGGGGSLGYSGLSNSVALEFNIYSVNTIGIGIGTNGQAAGPYVATGLLNLASGDPIGVSVEYLSGMATLSLTDALASTSYTTNFLVNVPKVIGSSNAYVGFTSADGGVASAQTITNFFFSSLPTVGAAKATAGGGLVIVWPVSAPGLVLQSSPSLLNPDWVTLTNLPTVVNGNNQVTITPSGTGEFFRLTIQ
ncbi:MAG TPA: immunoglobulin domain-containing protein [Verrucomicrobiae bacterium]|jgi:hypothetical protein|nr:immunoglobulin domain-containing protein [Verrucomicrobiae bacterium]